MKEGELERRKRKGAAEKLLGKGRKEEGGEFLEREQSLSLYLSTDTPFRLILMLRKEEIIHHSVEVFISDFVRLKSNFFKVRV